MPHSFSTVFNRMLGVPMISLQGFMNRYRSGLASVTVSGPSSFVCDCLATAALVLGCDKAEAMLSAWNAAHQTDYKAFFIEE